MKIALTGAGGYLGTHLLDALTRYKGVDTVACFRRSDHGRKLPPGTAAAVFDIAQSDGVYERLGQPDVLIHLAWGGLPNYQSLHHFEEELPRQYGFVKSMVEQGLKAVVVTGTCYEYGMSSGELVEDVEATPANPYGYAKAALRRQLRFLQSSLEFRLTWARLFYSFGEGQAPSSLYSQLRASVARGDTVFPMSRGEQLRDFMPIEAMADDLARVAQANTDADVNVCSGRPTSVRRLVESWLDQNGWQIDLELGRYPYPAHEPLAFWGSRARLDRVLDGG